MNRQSIELLKRDYMRYTNRRGFSWINLFIEMRGVPGLHYMMWFRLTEFSEQYKCFLVHKICKKKLKRLGIKYGFDIPWDTKIGGGFLIKHYGLIIINHMCEIGENCTILPGTVIGKAKGKVPHIGKDVSIGANVTIIGDIIIKDRAVIGAGSVVVHDVSEGSVVVGNPAHCIK